MHRARGTLRASRAQIILRGEKLRVHFSPLACTLTTERICTIDFESINFPTLVTTSEGGGGEGGRAEGGGGANEVDKER